MSNNAVYSCTALVGSNKIGILKADENGYYTVVLGALDVFNNAGSFYPYESAKSLFQQSSSLMRRIANGACRAEYGHPNREPGMSDQEYIARILRIDEKNICAHIAEVWIDTSSIKDLKTGRPVVAIMGKVKPMGPYGHVLEAQFKNPKENVAFSIRSLTDDIMRGGINNKNIRIIVCWDYVNEPGIGCAYKFNSPSLESTVDAVPALESIGEEMVFTATHFGNIRDYISSNVGMESSGTVVSAEAVIEAFEWEKTPEEKAQAKLPASFKW